MKQFGKSLLVLLLVPVLVLACAVPACADLFWEPDYEFWREHHSQVETAEHIYEFAGENGSVAFYSRPGKTVLEEVPNGDGLYIKYTWFDGTELWGCTRANSKKYGRDIDIWVRMIDMLRIYDAYQFRLDHEAEIERNVDLSFKFEAVKCFPYPNGPEQDAVMIESPINLNFRWLYTDEAGLRWGGRSAHKSVDWYCIDEPLIEGTPERKYILSPEQEARAAAKDRQKTLILAAVLVAAVVIVTIVLIRKIPKRQKAPQPENEDTQGD